MRKPNGLSGLPNGDMLMTIQGDTTNTYTVATSKVYVFDPTAGGTVTPLVWADLYATRPSGTTGVRGTGDAVLLGDTVYVATKASNGTNYLYRIPVDTSTYTPKSVPAPIAFSGVSTSGVYGLASLRGELYAINSTDSAVYKVNTSTGALVAVGGTYTVVGDGMTARPEPWGGFCPATITVNKSLGSNRVADTDQFTMQIKDSGGAVVSPASYLMPNGTTTVSSTTTGNTNAVATNTGVARYIAIAKADGTFGTYGFGEAPSGTTNLSNYVASIGNCSNSTVGGTSTSGITSLSSTITPKAGDAITCTITNTIAPPPAPALTVTKTASLTTDNGTVGKADAGDVITYSVSVKNTGNTTINSLVVKDSLEGGAATTLTCTPTTLAAGATATCTSYSYTVTQTDIDNNAGGDGILKNVATATGTPTAGTLAPATGTTSTTVVTAAPALTLSKVAGTPTTSKGTYTAYTDIGDTIPYTFTVKNTGNVTVNSVAISDAKLDAAASCLATTLAPGASTTCTGTHTLIAADFTAGSVLNTATAAGTPASGGSVTSPQAQATVTLTPLADLSLSKTVDKNTPKVGDTVTFTVTLSNAGPSSATGITVADALPSGYTLSGTPTTSAGSYAGGVWSVSSLASGASATLTISATVNASGNYTNTAQVTAAAQTDPDSTPNNNLSTEDDQASSTPTVTPVADLGVTKDDSRTTVSTNDTVNYIIRVTNYGPSSVTGAKLTDAAVAGLNVTAVACNVVTGNTCTTTSTPTVAQLQAGYTGLPTLASGAFYEIKVTGTITATTGSVINSVTVTNPAGTVEPTTDPHPNTASDTDTLTAAVDLSLTKTGPAYAKPSIPANPTATPPVAAAPVSISYTLKVSNVSTSAASSGTVTVTDTLPAGLIPTAISGTGWTCTNPIPSPFVSPYQLTCTRSDALAAGSSYPDITVTVQAPDTTTLESNAALRDFTNSATVSGGGDTTSGNNTSTANTKMIYVKLVKSVRNVTVNGEFSTTGSGGLPGEVMAYCIDFTNYGGVDISNFVVTDNVPKNTKALLTAYDADEPSSTTGFGVRQILNGVNTYYTSAADADKGSLTSSGGTNGNGVMTFNYGTLPAGQTATSCFRVTIN